MLVKSKVFCLGKLIYIVPIIISILASQKCFADPLDSITIDPNAQIALRQNTTVSAGQSKCSAAYAKESGLLEIDFAVEPSNAQLGMLVLDSQQVQALDQGQQFQGAPLLRLMISGVASQSTMLPQSGQFWLCFVNNGNTDVNVEIRASFRPVD